MSEIDDDSTEELRELRSEMENLWSAAYEIRTANFDTDPFEFFIAADYASVFDSLVRLRGRHHRFLEWGSGLGVVSIMASRLGFEAKGIESVPELVDHAKVLATEFGEPKLEFYCGSFIPESFEYRLEDGDDFQHTDTDSPSAYDEMDWDIQDFDLIYAYPWPDEHALYHNIMRQFAASGTLLVTYDEREGIQSNTF